MTLGGVGVPIGRPQREGKGALVPVIRESQRRLPLLQAWSFGGALIYR